MTTSMLVALASSNPLVGQESSASPASTIDSQNRFRASNPKKARKDIPIGGKVIPETEFSVQKWHQSQNMTYRYDFRFAIAWGCPDMDRSPRELARQVHTNSVIPSFSVLELEVHCLQCSMLPAAEGNS
jgi:hypothetical protein